MDSEVLKLGSIMILGGATAVLSSSYFPTNIQGDLGTLGFLAFILGSLLVALTVIER